MKFRKKPVVIDANPKFDEGLGGDYHEKFKNHLGV